jgi:hypothetical protein
MLSSTHRRSIVNNIKKIDASTFTEIDIKTLLIDIRELVNPKSFTKELCHFIAHPGRDKGLCYEEINLRAITAKQSVVETKIFRSSLDLITIKKDLYELLFIAGLRKWKSHQFPSGGKNKSDESSTRDFISKLYTLNKKDNSYTLNDLARLNEVTEIVEDILSGFRLGLFIDTNDIISTLNEDIKEIYRKHITGSRYCDSILNHRDDIIICLFTLFQDSQFKIFDGSVGNFRLVFHDKRVEMLAPGQSMPPPPQLIEEAKLQLIELYKNSQISLVTEFPMILPNKSAFILSDFILSKLTFGEYVPMQTIEEHVDRYLNDVHYPYPSYGDMQLVKEFHLVRDANNKLWIINE